MSRADADTDLREQDNSDVRYISNIMNMYNIG